MRCEQFCTIAALGWMVCTMAVPAPAQIAVHGPDTPDRPPFAEFDPSRCAVVLPIVERLVRHDDLDSTAWVPTKDTLSRVAVDSIRMCDAIYQGLTTDERHLLNLARVKLALGDDLAARVARRHYLAILATRSIREQGWAYYLILSDNLNARPPRLGDTREALRQLDALPFRDTWKANLLAHTRLAGVAKTQWDEPLAKAEASIAIAKWWELPPDERSRWAGFAAGMFLLKAEQELRLVSLASARTVLDTARTLIPPNTDAYREIIRTIQMYTKIGLRAAPIEAQFWYRAPDAVPRPATGRVTFISAAKNDCGLGCYGRYHALGRYEHQYGSRGLEVVNLTQTWGFYADTAPMAPEVEARHDSLYFFGHMQLPGMLAVYETKYTWRLDGRRRNQPTPQEINYAYASVILVDKRGIVRYIAIDWEDALEIPIKKFVEKLLGEPGPAPTALAPSRP